MAADPSLRNSAVEAGDHLRSSMTNGNTGAVGLIRLGSDLRSMSSGGVSTTVGDKSVKRAGSFARDAGLILLNVVIVALRPPPPPVLLGAWSTISGWLPGVGGLSMSLVCSGWLIRPIGLVPDQRWCLVIGNVSAGCVLFRSSVAERETEAVPAGGQVSPMPRSLGEKPCDPVE